MERRISRQRIGGGGGGGGGGSFSGYGAQVIGVAAAAVPLLVVLLFPLQPKDFSVPLERLSPGDPSSYSRPGL